MKITKTLLSVVVLGMASIGAANATWTCSVVDAKNITFTGTHPSDRGAALANAMAACSAGSKYARNCVVQNCTQQ